jgi:hypothetical protein
VHAQKWEEEQARLESEDHANYSLVQDLINEAAQLDGHTQALQDLVRSAHGPAVAECGRDSTFYREHCTKVMHRARRCRLMSVCNRHVRLHGECVQWDSRASRTVGNRRLWSGNHAVV